MQVAAQQLAGRIAGTDIAAVGGLRPAAAVGAELDRALPVALLRARVDVLEPGLGLDRGLDIGVQRAGVDAGAFWSQMQASVDLRYDVVNGIIKSFVFGIAVTWIAVLEGYEAPPTAEGVSGATTRTVVTVPRSRRTIVPSPTLSARARR